MPRLGTNLDSSFFVLAALESKTVLTIETDCRRAGIRTETRRGLVAAEDVPPRATALVWLVDDCAANTVVVIADRLRAQRPGLRIVLLTARPDYLTALLAHVSGRVAPIVLSKQASGADILRSLRSRAAA